jgi:Rhs element Vgr protein
VEGDGNLASGAVSLTMSVVTATILSEGSPIDPGYQLLSIDIRREVNRIPSARLVLLDGDLPNGTFPISDSQYFEPGKNIEIRLRGEDAAEDTTVFEGLVVCHGVEADSVSDCRLWVDLKDAAVKLTQVRKGKVFLKVTDSDLIKSIIEAGGLRTGRFTSTESQHPEIVQFYCTDWDFILSRADANGLLVVVTDGEISLQKPDLQGNPKYHVEFGTNIYNFEIEADATHQFAELQSVGWDLKAQKSTEPRTAKSFSLSQSNLDGSRLAAKVGYGPYTLSHPVPLELSELQAWADGRMVRSRMSMIRGRVSTDGRAYIKLLDLIEIKSIGERFNGTAQVTGISHRLESGDWRTDLQFGLSPHRFCRESEILEVPSAGLLPAVSGIQIGVVVELEEDPERQFRVKVLLPSINDSEAGRLWARVSSPYAGNGRGQFFRPEPGDDVIVGFLNNDPRQAVILGALYNSRNAPPKALAEPADKNLHKGFVTKKGTTLHFVDGDKASVFIETPEKNKIRFDDDSGGIYISDQHGNTITMDKNGIQLKSAKDLTIEARGNVEIKGSKVDVK